MIKTLIVAMLVIMFMPVSDAMDGVMPVKLSKDSICHVETFQYKNNKIYVVKSEIMAASLFSPICSTLSDIPRRRVWLEIYVAISNRIVLCKIIMAKIIPAKAEDWVFKDFDKSDFE